MKKITFLDIVISLLLFFLVIAILYFQFFGSSKNEELSISTSKENYFYNLNQKIILNFQGDEGITKIEIDNGKFRFVESPCKNKICIKQGWVSIQKFPVICLPNRVSAYIIDHKNDDEYDGVTR